MKRELNKLKGIPGLLLEDSWSKDVNSPQIDNRFNATPIKIWWHLIIRHSSATNTFLELSEIVNISILWQR